MNNSINTTENDVNDDYGCIGVGNRIRMNQRAEKWKHELRGLK